jgi:hypothetical protein
MSGAERGVSYQVTEDRKACSHLVVHFLSRKVLDICFDEKGLTFSLTRLRFFVHLQFELVGCKIRDAGVFCAQHTDCCAHNVRERTCAGDLLSIGLSLRRSALHGAL